MLLLTVCVPRSTAGSAPPFMEIGKWYDLVYFGDNYFKVLDLGKDGWVKVQWRADNKIGWLNTNAAIVINPFPSETGLAPEKSPNNESKSTMSQKIKQMETDAQENPSDTTNLVLLGSAYLQIQQTNRAIELFDTALAHPGIGYQEIAVIASCFAQVGNYSKLEMALKRMVSLSPNQPEPLYDLAALQAFIGEQAEALKNLKPALDMSRQRLAKDPAAHDLINMARSDNRFERIRSMPEFQKIVSPESGQRWLMVYWGSQFADHKIVYMAFCGIPWE